MVSFSDSMAVECLKINGSSWLSCLFRADNHPMAPCDWGTYRDLFYDAETHILIESGFYVFMPMNRDWDGCVVGYRVRITVDHEAKW